MEANMKTIRYIICIELLFLARVVQNQRENNAKGPSNPFSDLPPYVSVQKCFCKMGEVWDKQMCIKKDTFIPMVHFAPWNETTVNSTALGVSAISLVKCKPDQIRHLLKAGSFYIIEKGDLFHLFTGLTYSVGEYCIEHIFGRNNNTRLDALTCLSRPRVRRCCPEEHVLDSKLLRCVYSANAPFNPKITKEPSVIRWDSIDGPYDGLPSCYGSEIYSQVDLENDTEAALLYRSNGIFLHWKRAPYDTPYLVGPNDYCVAVEKWNDQFYHRAVYCDEPVTIRTATRVLYRRRNRPHREIILFSVIVLPVPHN